MDLLQARSSLFAGKRVSSDDTSNTPKLAKALSRSLDFCREYPQEAFAIYVEATKDSPKVLSDERAQWEVTLPLLAKTQEPLSRELLESLLVTLSTTCPDLRTSIDTFSIETLISDASETIASS